MELFQYMDMEKFPPENSDGNVEYKSSLKSITPQKFHKLATQMKWRLSQGLLLYNKNEAYYVIGIFDNGNFANIDIDLSEDTISILSKVCTMCNAMIDKIYVHKYRERLVHILKIMSIEEDEFYPLI